MNKDFLMKDNEKELEQLDLFEETDPNISSNDYDDLELEIVKSTKKNFLNWKGF